MERVIKLNIKVDVLLGFDRDFDASITKKSASIEIVHDQKQNRPAFDYLYERKIAAVNVGLPENARIAM
jgi:uncharacterized membrane protein YfhO